MTTARLLTSFAVASGANAIVVTAGAVQSTLTLSAGTYFWSLDDSVTAGALGIGKALEDLLVTHAQIATAAITIYGVNVTDATKADGRVKYECDVDFSFDFNSASFTLPKDILGYAATDVVAKSSTSTVLSSSFVHRYGWYPQIDAVEDLPTTFASRLVEYSTGGYVDSVDYGELDQIRFAFDLRSPALVRIVAGTVSPYKVAFPAVSVQERGPHR